MFEREGYMHQLMEFKDADFIKIISGVRRCGKSMLLKLFRQKLLSMGTDESNVVYINFESMKYADVNTPEALYSYVREHAARGKFYLLLDEVQNVRGWERAVNSVKVDFDADIYVTGSNAKMLSSELATLLSGRYVEIKMLPLSFKEFLKFYGSRNIAEQFSQYLRIGGMPSLSELKNVSDENVSLVLSGIYDSVIVKDVAVRGGVGDISLLNNVTKYIFDNIGNPVSAKKIADYLASSGRRTSCDTVENYLSLLESAFIIYKAPRYDTKGKQILKTLGKYYAVDVGLRNAILGYRDADYGHILENVVFLELKRRRYEVCVGKVGDSEVDFVATRHDEKKYLQVAYSVSDTEVLKRELASLVKIRDQHEKIIITQDANFICSHDGVKVQNITEFLQN